MRAASEMLTPASRAAPSASRSGSSTESMNPGWEERTKNALGGQSPVQLTHGLCPGKSAVNGTDPT